MHVHMHENVPAGPLVLMHKLTFLSAHSSTHDMRFELQDLLLVCSVCFVCANHLIKLLEISPTKQLPERAAAGQISTSLCVCAFGLPLL